MIAALAVLANIAAAIAASVNFGYDAAEIPGRYVVVLNSAPESKAMDLASAEATIASYGASVLRTYSIGTFQGFSVEMPARGVAGLGADPAVALVEPDVAGTVQVQGSPWGLGRISHRNISGLGDFSHYEHDPRGGSGVDVYVIDSGIYVNHSEFEAPPRHVGPFPLPGLPQRQRARWGANFVDYEADEDLLGHGTHCAGTAAGTTVGVAPEADLIAVKVCNRNGDCLLSDVIAGIEYAVSQHAQRLERNSDNDGYKGAVLSVALRFLAARAVALTLATNAAVFQGVSVIAAAGNDDGDACMYSPAAATEALTVGAIDYHDRRASFSNYGSCIDIWAPGVGVLSAGVAGKHSTKLASGTSMATPHIAGVAAYYLSLAAEPFTTPRSLKEWVISQGIEGVVSDVGPRSPNVLAFNGGS